MIESKAWAEHMINEVLPGPRPRDAMPDESVEEYARRTGKLATPQAQGLSLVRLP